MTGIDLPKSFSNVGRTADAANKRSTRVHIHKPKIVLKPWDGLDLVEQILNEARGDSRQNPRECLALSSPRVNPVLEDKVSAESSATAFSSFIHSTAQNLESRLPAARERQIDKSEKDVCEQTVDVHVSSPVRHIHRAKMNRPSACFLSRTRPAFDDSRAPPVGKYFPKFGVVECRAPTPIIPKHRRVKPHHTVHEKEVPVAVSMGELTDTLMASGSGAEHTIVKSETPTESKPYRKHEVRDVSSAFKSNTPRSTSPGLNDLVYWPLPFTGSTTYHGGAFHGNARERAYTPFGSPQGSKADYNVVAAQSMINRPSSVDFSRFVPREEHKTRIMYPSEDTTNLSYNPDDLKSSTKRRFGAHVQMSNQTTRPPPRAASPGDGLDPYFNSVVGKRHKGFVDIKRMVYHTTAYANEDTAQPVRLLTPEYHVIERSSPAISIPRAGRDIDSSQHHVTDVSYNADDHSIRRHRPAFAIPKGERKTFDAKRVCVRDEPYNCKDESHVTAIEFGKQISREVRDRRFEFN